MSEEKIKVSACLITYNHKKYIKECIEGALNQILNTNYEIIIGDDCSSDGTSEICKFYAAKYPECIKYYRREKNLGMMGNWLTTINQCQGKYIALCEGDDFWTDPYKLQKQVAYLEANPDFVLNFHHVNILEPDGSLVEDYLTRVPIKFESIQNLAQYGNYIHTPSVVFRNIIRLFPTETIISPIGDYILYMLLAEHGKIGKINEVMAVYRHQTGYWSSQSKTSRSLKLSITYSILQSLFQHKKDISTIFDLRKKQELRKLDWGILKHELQLLRDKGLHNQFIDEIFIESLQYYQSQFLIDEKLKKLLPYTIKRVFRKVIMSWFIKI